MPFVNKKFPDKITHPVLECNFINPNDNKKIEKNCISLIDTGATHTAVDLSIPKKLGLKPISKTSAITAGGKVEDVYIYEISLTIKPFEPLILQCLAMDLYDKQRIYALIGCDYLCNFYFVFDGHLNMIKIGK